MPATEVFATFRYLGQVHLEPLYCLAHWSAFAIKVKKVKLPLPSCSSSVVSSFLTGFFLFVPFFSFQFQLPLICPTIFLLFYYSNTCFYIPISILFLPHAISNLPSYKQMHLSKFKSEQFGSFKKILFFFWASYFSQGEIDWCSINTFIIESQYAFQMHFRPISLSMLCFSTAEKPALPWTHY